MSSPCKLKAVLKETGEVVAVKVQHRYVKNHSFVDIYTMDFLVRMIKVIFPQFEFMWLADVRIHLFNLTQLLQTM